MAEDLTVEFEEAPPALRDDLREQKDSSFFEHTLEEEHRDSWAGVGTAMKDGFRAGYDLTVIRAAMAHGVRSRVKGGPKTVDPARAKKDFGLDLDQPISERDAFYLQAIKEDAEMSLGRGLDRLTDSKRPISMLSTALGGMVGVLMDPIGLGIGAVINVLGKSVQVSKLAVGVAKHGNKVKSYVQKSAAYKAARASTAAAMGPKMINLSQVTSSKLTKAAKIFNKKGYTASGAAVSSEILIAGKLEQELGYKYNYVGMAGLGFFAPAVMGSIGLVLRNGVNKLRPKIRKTKSPDDISDVKDVTPDVPPETPGGPLARTAEESSALAKLEEKGLTRNTSLVGPFRRTQSEPARDVTHSIPALPEPTKKFIEGANLSSLRLSVGEFQKSKNLAAHLDEVSNGHFQDTYAFIRNSLFDQGIGEEFYNVVLRNLTKENILESINNIIKTAPKGQQRNKLSYSLDEFDEAVKSMSKRRLMKKLIESVFDINEEDFYKLMRPRKPIKADVPQDNFTPITRTSKAIMSEIASATPIARMPAREISLDDVVVYGKEGVAANKKVLKRMNDQFSNKLSLRNENFMNKQMKKNVEDTNKLLEKLRSQTALSSDSQKIVDNVFSKLVKAGENLHICKIQGA